MRFTQKHARAIANKLNAPIENRKRHYQCIVMYCGKIVAKFGIRRSSKEIGHDFVPEQLRVTRKQAEELARCTLDKEDYFGLLAEQGYLSRR